MTMTALYNICLVLYRRTLEAIKKNERVGAIEDDWYVFGQRDAIRMILDILEATGEVDQSKVLTWKDEETEGE